MKRLTYAYAQAAMLRLLCYRLCVMLLIYTAVRAAFVVYNYQLLSAPGIPELVRAFVGGLRFDWSILMYVNALVVLLHVLPFRFRFRRWYRSLLKWVFYLCNVPMLVIALVDIAYFPFTLKRATADMTGMAGDLPAQMMSYLRGYWFMFPCLAVLLLVVEALYRVGPVVREHALNPVAQWVLFLLAVGLWVLSARGGWQLKPLSPINATEYASPQLAPAVTNTPFTFLYSTTKKKLPERRYFTNDDARRYFDIHHNPKPNLVPNKMNVVVIVLESFSREYFKRFGGTYNITPFLDSLYSISLGCDNAYANAKHSNEGIPAVLASLPTLLDESFISSVYQENAFTGLGSLLKPYGYSTAFFHGAQNGTFNFDKFTARAGFDKYYGKNEYPNQSEYDGQWGIYDEPYLQYVNQQLSKTQQPFCAGIFTLSSHFPFNLPEPYKTMYRNVGTHPIHPCVKYTDHAVMEFFKAASQEPWFNNTLFVITADHTSQASKPEYNTPLGTYRIPIIFYAPGTNLRGTVKRAAMQVDIMPSIADFLKLPAPYVAFGQSVFDSTASSFAYQYRESIYQACDDSMFVQFDGERPIAVYNYRRDSLLHKRLTTKALDGVLLNRLKSVIQQYNAAMNGNKLE